MAIRNIRLNALVILALAGIVIAGCTRSVAGTGAVPSATPPGAAAGAPTGGAGTGPEATMNAVRSMILTQTAEAVTGVGGGGEGGGTATVPAGTATSTAATATPLPPTATAVPSNPATYTVQQGEWIYAIARKFNVDPNALLAANPGVDPNHIEPGQVLNIPAPGSTAGTGAVTPEPKPKTYTVQQGEWVYSIGRKFGVDPNAIIQANNLQPPNYTVYPGQVLTIP